MAEAAFFTLLRSGLWGTPLAERDFPDGIDWKGVLALASMHTVTGVVAEAATRLPVAIRPAGKVAEALMHCKAQMLRAHMMLDRALADVVSCLRQSGIEGVVLKGQGVARLYRDPLMRHCGDIDLYVGRDNYARAIESACRRFEPDRDTRQGEGKHFSLKHGRVTVELHRRAAQMYNPLRNRAFQAWASTELESKDRCAKAVFDGVEAALPSVGFDALFIFYHMWHHYMLGGVGLRQMCDWVLVLDRHWREIDRGELERNIRRFGLARPWRAFAGIAVDRLGLDPAKMPLYDKSQVRASERVLARMMAGGNFGTHVSYFYSHKRGENLVARKSRTLAYLLHSAYIAFPMMPAEAVCMVVSTAAGGAVRLLRECLIRPFSH